MTYRIYIARIYEAGIPEPQEESVFASWEEARDFLLETAKRTLKPQSSCVFRLVITEMVVGNKSSWSDRSDWDFWSDGRPISCKKWDADGNSKTFVPYTVGNKAKFRVAQIVGVRAMYDHAASPRFAPILAVIVRVPEEGSSEQVEATDGTEWRWDNLRLRSPGEEDGSALYHIQWPESGRVSIGMVPESCLYVPKAPHEDPMYRWLKAIASFARGEVAGDARAVKLCIEEEVLMYSARPVFFGDSY